MCRYWSSANRHDRIHPGCSHPVALGLASLSTACVWGSHLANGSHLTEVMAPLWLPKDHGHLRAIAVNLKLARSPMEASAFWRERPRHIRTLGTYVPGQYPGKVILFLASQTMALRRPTDFDWVTVAGGGLDLHIIPGDHDSVLGPDVRAIAEAIRTLYFGEH